MDWMIGAVAGAAGTAAGLAGAGIASSVPALGPARLPARWWTGSPAPPRLRMTVSAGSGLLAAATGAVLGAQIMLPACWVLAIVAVPLTVVDVRRHRLPDLLVAPIAATALLCGLGAWLAGAPSAAAGLVRMLLAGAGILAVGTIVVLASPSTGYGDVKLLAATGALTAWWGWEHLLAGITVGYAVAAVAALATVVARRGGWRSGIAIGPALLAGAAATILT